MTNEITKERKEQLSNRLVLNFGILLGAALILLYVNNALRSGGTYAGVTYTILLILGIIGAIGAIGFFLLGKFKYPKLKNYSAIFLGDFVICAMLYAAKLSSIPGYGNIEAVIAVYVAMASYFIIMAIITGIQVNKPIAKEKTELDTTKSKRKNKKKRR